MKVRCIEADTGSACFTVGWVYDMAENGLIDDFGHVFKAFLGFEGKTLLEKWLNFSGLTIFEEVKEEKFTVTISTMAESIKTNNYEVEMWYADNMFSVHNKDFDLEMLEIEEMEELVYILQEAVKLSDKWGK